MAAGGFKEFVAGEVLDQDEINDFLMQGVLVFAGTAARASAIPSPVEGQFSFRTDEDVTEFYDGSDWVPLAATGNMSFLIVGGGGGGAGGGGAGGGYIAAWNGEVSGGSATPVANLQVESGEQFNVTIGAGGAAGGVVTANGTKGNNSRLGLYVAEGGGFGAADTTSGSGGGVAGGAGGSGGGGAVFSENATGAGGKTIVLLGRDGGTATLPGGVGYAAAGGGGAGGVGASVAEDTGFLGTGGLGGAGLPSTITGSSVTRAAGAAGYFRTGNAAGGTNTGNGGGGKDTTGGGSGFAGGSGVVIVRVPSSITFTIGPGLTSSSTTVGSDTVYTFTAGSDTVTVN
jgi:hypothetical protein